MFSIIARYLGGLLLMVIGGESFIYLYQIWGDVSILQRIGWIVFGTSCIGTGSTLFWAG